MRITEIFYEVWAENSRSKPPYPYVAPPKGVAVFAFSMSKSYNAQKFTVRPSGSLLKSTRNIYVYTKYTNLTYIIR